MVGTTCCLTILRIVLAALVTAVAAVVLGSPIKLAVVVTMTIFLALILSLTMSLEMAISRDVVLVVVSAMEIVPKVTMVLIPVMVLTLMTWVITMYMALRKLTAVELDLLKVSTPKVALALTLGLTLLLRIIENLTLAVPMTWIGLTPIVMSMLNMVVAVLITSGMTPLEGKPVNMTLAVVITGKELL